MRKCQKRPIIRQKRPTNTSIPDVCKCEKKTDLSGKKELDGKRTYPLINADMPRSAQITRAHTHTYTHTHTHTHTQHETWADMCADTVHTVPADRTVQLDKVMLCVAGGVTWVCTVFHSFDDVT